MISACLWAKMTDLIPMAHLSSVLAVRASFHFFISYDTLLRRISESCYPGLLYLLRCRSRTYGRGLGETVRVPSILLWARTRISSPGSSQLQGTYLTTFVSNGVWHLEIFAAAFYTLLEYLFFDSGDVSHLVQGVKDLVFEPVVLRFGYGVEVGILQGSDVADVDELEGEVLGEIGGGRVELGRGSQGDGEVCILSVVQRHDGLIDVDDGARPVMGRLARVDVDEDVVGGVSGQTR